MKKTILVFFLALLLINGTLPSKAANTSIDIIPPLPSTVIAKDSPENANAVDPRAYGAKADGVTDDAVAIQKAINSCAQKGGGIVVLKNGTFLSSPLVLKTGVYLKIEALTVLKAVPYADYPKNIKPQSKPAALVGAKNASHFGVFGNGTIDGNGQDWWRTQGWQGEDLPKLKIPNTIKRPSLLDFSDCSDIIVKDVTLQNSPQLTLVPHNSDNVVISNVKIYNPANSHNTDGIDPSGNNVFIDGCTIDTGDDNIAIKGQRNGSTQNIYITNSTFYHGHGLSIGSDFVEGVENVYAKNITFADTETGIRIKSVRGRGGLVNNANFSDITMKNVGRAIVIAGYYPKIPPAGEDVAQAIISGTPRYQNITISGITATAVKEAGAIVGLPESPIQGVTLTNVMINAPRGLTIRNAQVSTTQTTINAANGPEYVAEENSVINSN
ncbi:glycoside hydrolase family 28 protein [Pelosinus propionicus]|uniref:Polygalacturonase n=1 Tax=Pelosinus propionicus DSM 13327 TaxID=1123291 RepID=A0A1I4JVS6_9FIRM|nr:glycosyl hydrolase family 28 protein [Pelosinus propionicus]SFL70650.1 Polygalacturonase [Pelosinus propionicus DSM 13327]